MVMSQVVMRTIALSQANNTQMVTSAATAMVQITERQITNMVILVTYSHEPLHTTDWQVIHRQMLVTNCMNIIADCLTGIQVVHQFGT
jgi:hypothetical protein